LESQDFLILQTPGLDFWQIPTDYQLGLHQTVAQLPAHDFDHFDLQQALDDNWLPWQSD